MKVHELLSRAEKLEFLSAEEGLFLFEEADTALLMHTADRLRKHHIPDNKVTWIIDRNSNTTNVCVANCKFCNFYRVPGHPESYITSIDQYKGKIEELFRFGGNQLLLQGGHHPELGLDFYTNLFSELKSLYPSLKLHALGPPEIVHIAELGGYTFKEVLLKLRASGMDTLPGAGAEILDDRVRFIISNGKCNRQDWLDVMRAAHQIGMASSATMMFGHIETNLERMEHIVSMRQVQSEKPADSIGFTSFILWPFMDEGTLLKRLKRARNVVTSDEYIRMIAISRILLPNIKNIGASWLTVGKQVAQVCLHAGANDFGSIMIEENVVSAAGANFRFTAQGIQDAIESAGFIPQFRDQEYNHLPLPNAIEQQSLDISSMIVD